MSEKNVLAFLGSPHTNGMTAAMLNFTVHKPEQAGYAVTKITLLGTAMEETNTFPKPRLRGKQSTGKVVCANAKNKKELPKRTMKKIERCLK